MPLLPSAHTCALSASFFLAEQKLCLPLFHPHTYLLGDRLAVTDDLLLPLSSFLSSDCVTLKSTKNNINIIGALCPGLCPSVPISHQLPRPCRCHHQHT